MSWFNGAQRRFIITGIFVTVGVIVATTGILEVVKLRQEEINQKIAALNRKPLQLIQDFPPATKIYTRNDLDAEITYIDVYYFSYGGTLTPGYEASFWQDENICGSSNKLSGDNNQAEPGRYLVNLTFERKTVPLKYTGNLSTGCIPPTFSLKINFVSVDVPASDDYNWDEEGAAG